VQCNARYRPKSWVKRWMWSNPRVLNHSETGWMRFKCA